jgi:hypothetical protein
MQYVWPITLTDAEIVSLPEAETQPTYVPGTTYALDAVVRYQHQVYKSLQAGNPGHTPGAVGSTDWWLPQGPTNGYALLDGKLSTATVRVGGITLVAEPASGITGLVLLRTAGASAVHVTVTLGAITLYDSTFDMLETGDIDNWWDYYYGDWQERSELVLTDLPGIPGARITVDVQGCGSVSLGMLVLGQVVDLGEAQWSPEIGADDFSRVDADPLGETEITKRGYAKTFSVTCEAPLSQLDRIARALTRVLSVPVVWIAARGRFDALIAYGLGSWRLRPANAKKVYGQLDIKGFKQ